MATAEFEFDFSEDILYECVMQKYTRIVAGIDPKGEVLNKLFEKDTITMPEKVRIQELPEEIRGKALIDRLLSCQRPRAVAEFLEILVSSEERSYRDIAVEVHTAAQEMVSSALSPSYGIGRSSGPARQDKEALQPNQLDIGKYSVCNQYFNNFAESHNCLSLF